MVYEIHDASASTRRSLELTPLVYAVSCRYPRHSSCYSLSVAGTAAATAVTAYAWLAKRLRLGAAGGYGYGTTDGCGYYTADGYGYGTADGKRLYSLTRL